MRGTCVPFSLFNAYDPTVPIFTIAYGPSQFSWNFPVAGSVMFSKTFLKTRSPAQNVRCFTCLLYELVALCWYDAMRTVVASRSLSTMSKYFPMASVLTV